MLRNGYPADKIVPVGRVQKPDFPGKPDDQPVNQMGEPPEHPVPVVCKKTQPGYHRYRRDTQQGSGNGSVEVRLDGIMKNEIRPVSPVYPEQLEESPDFPDRSHAVNIQREREIADILPGEFAAVWSGRGDQDNFTAVVQQPVIYSAPEIQ